MYVLLGAAVALAASVLLIGPRLRGGSPEPEKCQQCPAVGLDDPVAAVAILFRHVLIAGERRCGDISIAADALKAFLPHLSDEDIAERVSVRCRCKPLAEVLAMVAPVINRSYGFAERARIIGFSLDILKKQGADETVATDVVKLLRRKLNLSAA